MLLPPLPSIPMLRAELVSRRLRAAGSTGASIHLTATGRTGSGKTTLANRLLGIDYFLSTGNQDCTRGVNLIRFPGGLSYSDLPGACSDDLLENVNRAVLGLDQAADFPTASEVEIAEFSGGESPDLKTVLTANYAESYPTPDLLLYVLAADKQFTAADRRYLTDLLARHRCILFVLNFFATSPPTDGNIRDIVKGVTDAFREVHRDGGEPQIVALDCRTGDGLPELVAAAKTLLGEQSGTLLADVLADQQRNVPVHYSRQLSRYILERAVAAAHERGGPVGGDHPLHRVSAILRSSIGELKSGQGAVGQSCAKRYRELFAVVHSAGSVGATCLQAGRLQDLARRIRASGLKRARAARAAVLDASLAAFAAASEAAESRENFLREARDSLTARTVELNERLLQFAKDDKANDIRLEERKAESEQIDRSRFELVEAQREHSYEVDRDRNRIDSFNDLIAEVNAGIPLDDASRRRLDRQGDALNRQWERLIRQEHRLNDELDDFNRAVQEFNDQSSTLTKLIDDLRIRRKTLLDELDDRKRLELQFARDLRRHTTSVEADNWSEVRFVGAANESVRHLDALIKTVERMVDAAEVRGIEIDRIRSHPEFNPAAAAVELSDAEAQLAILERKLCEATEALRGLWLGYVSDQAINLLLLRTAADHFDEVDGAAYRGTTYDLTGADGAALILAISKAAVSSSAALEFSKFLQQARNLVEKSREFFIEPDAGAPVPSDEFFDFEFESEIHRLEILSG